ncbi:MAG: hypothetical protein LBV32_02475 [Tannerellaceae bacterium]|jgi:hypothetical protein|nr:hypothetical protein [Tannerellaceae bacterium]
MKKMFTYLFVTLMAALVFYGGAGVNVASFCCQDCRSEGLEVLAGDKCCEIHGHSHDLEHETIEHADASFTHSNEMCCRMSRISFDWGFEKVSVENPQPVMLDLLTNDGVSTISVIPLPVVKEIMPVIPKGPPLPPRDYLSTLTTLLI